jgi:hypothetical protein
MHPLLADPNCQSVFARWFPSDEKSSTFYAETIRSVRAPVKGVLGQIAFRRVKVNERSIDSLAIVGEDNAFKGHKVATSLPPSEGSS